MKKYLSVLILLSIVLSSALAKTKKDEKSVSLTDVSSTLTKYETNDDYNFVKNEIIYKVVEKEKYDGAFKESAIIYATITQTRGTLNLIKENKLKLTNDFAISSMAFAVKDLPKIEDKIKELQNKMQQFDPKNDFKGMEARKAPAATKGIQIASEHLTKSLEQLPELLKDLNDIANKK